MNIKPLSRSLLVQNRGRGPVRATVICARWYRCGDASHLHLILSVGLHAATDGGSVLSLLHLPVKGGRRQF
jgi:hypothetical protein